MVCDLCRRNRRVAHSLLCEVCAEAVARLATAWRRVTGQVECRQSGPIVQRAEQLSGFGAFASEDEYYYDAYAQAHVARKVARFHGSALRRKSIAE
jgi:hypothetical protein